MSERTVPQVECALCGVPFDPTEAGGWCTNADCGEWQYETYADYDAGSAESEREADDAASEGAATQESEADDAASEGAATQESEADDAASEGATTQESGADDSGTPEPTTENVADPVAAAEGESHETPVEKNADGPDVDLDSCPECGADADPTHRFCTGCGTDLDEVRAGIAAVTSCPDCETDVDETDRYCTSCGADLLDAIGDDEASEGPPDELSLEAHGRSIVVQPGETVGREVRSLLADAGRPDDEAVRIHREHVRFVREEETFYVVDLGENPTAVNDNSLEKGDRVAIEPGDELTLSEVVTLTIGTKNS